MAKGLIVGADPPRMFGGAGQVGELHLGREEAHIMSHCVLAGGGNCGSLCHHWKARSQKAFTQRPDKTDKDIHQPRNIEKPISWPPSLESGVNALASATPGLSAAWSSFPTG